MEIDTDPKGYTILRIKRKRNEEPLDALVVADSSRRKKARPSQAFFKFAETVEEHAWDDEQQRKQLETRISSLSKSTVSMSEKPSQSTPVPTSTVPEPVKPSVTYTILRKPEDDFASNRPRSPTAPPKVWSTKELEEIKQKANFTIYDAVLSSSTAQEEDEEMAKFIPMLDDYLKMNDIALDNTNVSSPEVPKISGKAKLIPPPDEYVYDVFYHRPTDPALWNTLVNIGALTGLPPSLNDPYDSDSDSEPADEEDEDSNAEDFYRNDYPEDEESSEDQDSDEFHDGEAQEYYGGDDDGDDAFRRWR